ncbi:hypothetical protein [Desulfospira joergensenii]|uniref:hypothetical protein n=1 Tax=Desulfospira joergensenii TaxID=53329 RepID=UPI0003B38221|nr:hypothetical protein [Desulfospira joergensenii]
MFETAYTIKNFQKFIGLKEISSDAALLDRRERFKKSEEIFHHFSSGEYFKNSIKKISIKNKDAFIFKNIQSRIIERAFLNNIKKAYKIKIRSREAIIAVLISLLKENSPYLIHRFDIQNFYESCNTDLLEKKIVKDKRISAQSMRWSPESEQCAKL